MCARVLMRIARSCIFSLTQSAGCAFIHLTSVISCEIRRNRTSWHLAWLEPMNSVRRVGERGLVDQIIGFGISGLRAWGNEHWRGGRH